MDFDKIIDIILDSDNIVFFGGAGVSTESGIPDFRSATGLYNQQHDSGHSPEYLLSHQFLVSDPEGFSHYYRENLNAEGVKPNITHQVLAKLEEMGKLKAVVTQNIDGLHQKAGSKKVYEIHGNLQDHYCMKCGKTYSPEEVFASDEPFYCECGGFVRPDVTLYGEQLPSDAVYGAIKAISEADVLIVGGTSLAVYPAASFLGYYNGDKEIIINRDPTPGDGRADYVLHTNLGDFFRALDKKLD